MKSEKMFIYLIHSSNSFDYVCCECLRWQVEKEKKKHLDNKFLTKSVFNTFIYIYSLPL